MDTNTQAADKNNELVQLTADIVSAYVSNNTIVQADLPKLINDTFDSLSGAAAKAKEPTKEQLTPAVPIRRSVSPDQITCLECGKTYKSLKRHIGAEHDLTPQEYRAKWNLSHDYPVVAPSYAEARSKLAKRMGLGRKRGAS